MAFYQESWQWLHDQVHGKFIYCQLIKKDQYGRVVSVPYFSWHLSLKSSFFRLPFPT